MSDEIREQIADSLSQPRTVTGDEGSVTQHSLREQVEAAKYLAEQSAGKKKRLPIRLARIQPGGAA